jgi:hypothetical protein
VAQQQYFSHPTGFSVKCVLPADASAPCDNMLLVACINVFGLNIQDVWKYVNDNPEYSKCFNTAMASTTTIDLIAVRKYQGFKDIKTLVDVGGGVGKALETIISTYPHIHGINYDLPHVVADAPTMPGNRKYS